MKHLYLQDRNQQQLWLARNHRRGPAERGLQGRVFHNGGKAWPGPLWTVQCQTNWWWWWRLACLPRTAAQTEGRGEAQPARGHHHLVSLTKGFVWNTDRLKPANYFDFWPACCKKANPPLELDTWCQLWFLQGWSRTYRRPPDKPKKG